MISVVSIRQALFPERLPGQQLHVTRLKSHQLDDLLVGMPHGFFSGGGTSQHRRDGNTDQVDDLVRLAHMRQVVDVAAVDGLDHRVCERSVPALESLTPRKDLRERSVLESTGTTAGDGRWIKDTARPG